MRHKTLHFAEGFRVAATVREGQAACAGPDDLVFGATMTRSGMVSLSRSAGAG